VKIQLVLDTVAEREKVEVSDDEFGHEIVHRAQRAGMAAQAYYDQLVRSGMAAAIYGDVRRGKALGVVLERVKITDSSGAPVSLEDLRGGPEADEHEHDH
jgi:trigger factor